MTRSREPFVMLPHRFIDAEMRGDISERQAKLCRFIARHSTVNELGQRTACLTLEQIITGMRWPKSADTLMRELRALTLWFDFDSRRGQRTPYTFVSTGLAVISDSSAESRPPHDLRTNPPNPAEVALRHAEADEAGERHAQSREQPPQEPPQTPAALSSLTSCERSEAKAPGEEKLDHVVGKTTAAGSDRSITDRLIEKVEAHGRRSPPPGDDGYLDFIADVHRSGHVTIGEALEREALHKLAQRAQEAL